MHSYPRYHVLRGKHRDIATPARPFQKKTQIPPLFLLVFFYF
jgi:hypothetical protein